MLQRCPLGHDGCESGFLFFHRRQLGSRRWHLGTLHAHHRSDELSGYVLQISRRQRSWRSESGELAATGRRTFFQYRRQFFE